MSPSEQDEQRRRLRSVGREARRSIDGTERDVAELAIAGHLGHLDVKRGATIGVTIADDGEPDLSGFVEELWGRGHQVALPVPAADSASFTMEFRPWLDGDELVPGRFSIPCPPARPATVPDLVIVPLVRFDARGNRMGRGGGFYDRWLAANPAATPLGVAFEAQRASALAAQPHDVAMAGLVTELGIRWFRPIGTA